jgi:hypothetical protein
VPYNNSFRRLWAAEGYRTDLGSAATGEPPLKKFIRLYHLSSTKHAISNLQGKRLKIARFEDLNDPFEFRALEFRNKLVRAEVKNFGKEFAQTTGLLCFSEDWTSPVLWSHYAESHKGICLGFDVRRTKVRRVIYKSKRLQTALKSTEHPNPSILTPALRRALIRTKCHEWRYERERRMTVPLGAAQEDGGLLFSHFDDDLVLREIILGAKCNQSLDKVQEMASKHGGVKVFKSRLAWQHFKVVPVESSVP